MGFVSGLGRFGPKIAGAWEKGVNSLFGDEFANPLAVHPKEFDFVVTSAGVLDAGNVEFFDKLGLGINFLFGAVVPAEAGEIIKHGFGEHAVGAIFGDGFGAVTFSEFFLAVGAQNVG